MRNDSCNAALASKFDRTSSSPVEHKATKSANFQQKTVVGNSFQEFSKPILFEKLRNDLISNPRVVSRSLAASVLPTAAKISHF